MYDDAHGDDTSNHVSVYAKQAVVTSLQNLAVCLCLVKLLPWERGRDPFS